MALYRIYRMKDAPRQQFRWAAHSSGATASKQRDYEPGEAMEAASAYALWQSLRLTEKALQLGDILELPNGELRIFKYVGFDETQWIAPDTKPLIPLEGAGPELQPPPM